MYTGSLPGDTVLNAVFQKRLQGKAAYEEVLDAVLRMDFPGQAVFVAQLFHFQIQTGDLKLVLNTDQVSGFAQGKAVKLCEV